MPRDFTVPGALVLGSVIIGAGLYFGLQGRSSHEALLPAPSLPAEAPRQDAPLRPLGAGGGAGSPANAALEASRALEQARPAMRRDCWEPALRQAPEPSRSTYALTMVFDGATGHEIGRGISELRGEPSRSDVARCLREQPMTLQIPPPGQTVSVDLALALP